MINNLPVPDFAAKKDQIHLFISIVDYAKQLEFLDAYNTFYNVLNGLVFELYFPEHMEDRKIDTLQFIEKDLKKVMQNKEFDQLTDDQKKKVINQLHAKWIDPGSEIVKRINSFAEKSPDILKPILESR